LQNGFNQVVLFSLPRMKGPQASFHLYQTGKTDTLYLLFLHIHLIHQRIVETSLRWCIFNIPGYIPPHTDMLQVQGLSLVLIHIPAWPRLHDSCYFRNCITE
jgi:hypothetical protein